MDKQVLLKINNLKTYFPVKKGFLKRVVNHVKAVDEVSIDVYKGETLGLVGESGCGKTTLGKTILQLIKATGGEVLYNLDGNEKKITKKLNRDERTQIKQRIQIIFQDPHSSLNPVLSIFNSLQDPLIRFGIKSKKEQKKIIGDLLEAVNLNRDDMYRYPNEFSGGQRQRIGIARALSVSPDLIVCDEAVSSLDVSVQAQVLKLLAELKAERNLTYIFITHDLSVVEYISDRIAVMYLGKIVELANSKQLYNSTLHPYTKSLLSAIPVINKNQKSQRIVLEGDVPNPLNPPSGCAFHVRCNECMEICKKEVPLLRKIDVEDNAHYVACHLYS